MNPVVEICNERNELNFLFDLTKIVAESDSIGEGWGYCKDYSAEKFKNELDHMGTESSYDSYLEQAGLDLYERYLEQIKAK